MSKAIKLSNGGEALVDELDYNLLSKWSWHRNRDGYANRSTGKSSMSMHRQIMNPPIGLDVDHINRNRLDNCRSNLRVATRTINNLNRPIDSRNKLGHNGISLTSCGTYRVRIGKTDYGRCKTLKEAIIKRKMMEESIIKVENNYINLTLNNIIQ